MKKDNWQDRTTKFFTITAYLFSAGWKQFLNASWRIQMHIATIVLAFFSFVLFSSMQHSEIAVWFFLPIVWALLWIWIEKRFPSRHK